MKFSEYDRFLFHEGTLYDSYKKLGAHPENIDGSEGVSFAVYAPGAVSVNIASSFNNWNPEGFPMKKSEDGIWETFVPGMKRGDIYKYVIRGKDGITRWKADPYAFYSELRPLNSSVVYGISEDLENPAPCGTCTGTPEVSDKAAYQWHDGEYMKAVDSATVREKPMAIYEVHLGSWKKDYRLNKDGFLNYKDLANQLSEYVSFMGFTHVELMGILEHPFDGSWGYQITGYFAPTSRYGNPDDFRYFVDRMHGAGIGVIVDWVPAHFTKDVFGLENFDGTPLYESADPLLAEYPEWGTKAFDHSKPEVRDFLISNAFYWINEFHVDALRVDAVAAMIYTNFSRQEWRPNKFGGNTNLESIAFLKQLNKALREQTSAFLIAEDSSIEKGITSDVEDGGFGFMFKWNMGWMNDTLKFFEKDPVYRKYHHDDLTHTVDYVFTEYFINVLSHDEVVHLKKPMLEKMPGPFENKIRGLMCLYTYQFMHPGKKLLFMGQEFAEDREWAEDRDINWAFAEEREHRRVLLCVRKLLEIYKTNPALYSDSLNPVTFEWVNRFDRNQGVLAFLRRNPWNYEGALLVIINTTPVRYKDYSCGVPVKGKSERIFSTEEFFDAADVLTEQKNEQVISDNDLFHAKEEKRCIYECYKGLCDGYEYHLDYDLKGFECAVFKLS